MIHAPLMVLWLVMLAGGVFLLIPRLSSRWANYRLSKRLNLTVGRVVGLVISVASIILLYTTITG